MKTTSATGGRRTQILEAAARLFAGQGYAGAPIREIARACGITEAAIYRHFAGKADLYAEVIRTKAHQHDITGYLQGRVGQGSIEDVLRAVAEHVLALAKADPELMRLLLASRAGGDGGTDALFTEIRLPYIRFLVGELSRRMDDGEVAEVEPLITARCFVGMVMDCALSSGVWERIADEDFRADDVVCNNVPIFARGLERTAAPGAASNRRRP
ncbi:MAG TPA: TetR/AcrR family transcriptional regulator [Candidatus Krumholzibacteria bacterium]|nr:TetR/AcrR family transcriptional regulator [Candidatus Krumholzibacteria bacterium]